MGVPIICNAPLASNTCRYGAGTLTSAYASALISGTGHTINCSAWSFIGGGYQNCITPIGSTAGCSDFIGGGSANRICGCFSSVVGGHNNSIQSASLSVISGGLQSYISGASGAVIAGGARNCVFGTYGVIGGGDFNIVCNTFAAALSGNRNCNNSYMSVIAGGSEKLRRNNER